MSSSPPPAPTVASTVSSVTPNMAFAQSLLRKMLTDSLTEKHYDVYFIIHVALRDGTVATSRLGAHRVVLSAVSDAFDRATSPKREIAVHDCSPSAVKEALEIMYGGELNEAQKSVQLALEVWHFGVKFKVDHLIQLARTCCIDNLSNDNCLRILDFAVRVGDQEIVDKLQAYTCETGNFAHVISATDFERLDFQVISDLLRPGKGECAWPEILTFEKVWFDALVRWLAPRIHVTVTRGEEPSSPTQKRQQQEESSSPVPTEESVDRIQKVMELVDFSRMKTHELRNVARNEIPNMSPKFAPGLVQTLLARAENLENSVLERNIELDVLGQKYQQALCEQDEAERKVREMSEKVDKLTVAKQGLEKRIEEARRRKPATSSGGMASLNSTRRKKTFRALLGVEGRQSASLSDNKTTQARSITTLCCAKQTAVPSEV